MKREIQIISAPSILGLKPNGVQWLSNALLNAGLATKLSATKPVIDVDPENQNYSTQRDADTACINARQIYNFSLSLIRQLTQLDDAVFPIVLGGDCSTLLGIMPALKTAGTYGLIFMDAHADFYEPAKSTTGEVADMDLAIVTGRGPALLTDINGHRPYVTDAHVIHIGQRDAEEASQYGSQDIRETMINCFDLAFIKSKGLSATTASIIELMATLPVDGFWMHFDTDVIDDAENPAVDYRLPGGLRFEEVQHLLGACMATGKIRGISVTIYNPLLDADQSIAAKLINCLTEGLHA